MFSAAVGWGARRRWPRLLRGPLYTAFGRAVGARLDEAELPLDQYPTFGEFFSRRLRAGVRPIADPDGALIAPCDGVIAACGRMDDGWLIQAKGIDYRLDDLVRDPQLAATLAGGAYCTIYLSPRDYHRVHAPIAAALVGYRHVPGQRFPVNPLFTRHIDGLLVTNERVVIHLRSAHGDIAVVMVAAAGVGNIALTHAHGQRDRSMFRRGGTLEPTAVTTVARGAELGAFHLGSTVVLLCPPGALALHVGVGDELRFGQRIGGAMGEARG